MERYKTAPIHSFESMAAVDGEGIRYAVFFAGCPLRCVYCHNPDTWPEQGSVLTSHEIFEKIKRFKPYFKNGGGVTFSGGEPLLNSEFINELQPMLKEEGIGYCIDTSGSVPLTEDVARAIDGADMVMLDLKFYDAERYNIFTSGDIELPLEIGDYCTKNNKRLWLRTVIVPGLNDSEEDICEYAKLSKRFKFERYELLAFHTMGFFKYERAGIENPLKNTAALAPEKLKKRKKTLDAML